MRKRFALWMWMVAMLGGAPPSLAQAPTPGPREQALLARAAQLDQQGEQLADEGKLDAAISLVEQGLALREQALGARHREVATSLENLAWLYQGRGAYGKAVFYYARAFAIMEAHGVTPLQTAGYLHLLAYFYQMNAECKKAEPLYVRALAIREKLLDPMHRDLATGLNNLGSIYQCLGEFHKAESLLTRARDIRAKTLGETHPEFGSSLNNLGLLYMAQGAHGKAEELFARALDIFQQAHGPKHPEVATIASNLGSIYLVQRRLEDAATLFARVAEIQSATLGYAHPAVAKSLHNLAAAFRWNGSYEKAEVLLLEALAIREKALGPMHADTAITVNNLAGIYRARGNYAAAETQLHRVLGTLEKALGPDHPDLVTALNNVASIKWIRAGYSAAEAYFLRAADLRDWHLRAELGGLPESRKLSLMRMLRGDTDAAVSFHAHTPWRSLRAVELGLTTVLRNKGRVLDSLVDTQAALRSRLTPTLRQHVDQLATARMELTALLYGHGGAVSRAERSNLVTALRSRIESLEGVLSAASAEFRARSEPVTVANVQGLLAPGSALVELVRYRRAVPAHPQQTLREARYLAYVLRPNGPPRWVALGEAAPIDAEVEAFLAGMHRAQNMPPAEVEQRQRQARAALAKLHGLVLAPLGGALEGVSHLLVAPDGSLNLVPFEALIDGRGSYVIERYLVSYVSSGRDLLRMAPSRKAQSPSVVVAPPDYGPGSRFPALDVRSGAAEEARAVASHLGQVEVLAGKGASKAALVKLAGPEVLHVVTHGFYAQGVTGQGSRGAGAAQLAMRGMFLEGVEAMVAPSPNEDGVDPEFEALDRAGLALAGANLSGSGILTAREIAGLDWWGTKLVVLSACQTGQGALATGEGVYGLRRALVLAGAESQVVSLWAVSDRSTGLLMKAFYAELARGTGRAEALRRAKLALLEQPSLSHPYHWGAFIAAGDWRPLQRSVFVGRGQQR